MAISDFTASIATRRCALFAGSGLTSDSGGASWDTLIEYLKTEFHYSSPLDENFEIMTDLLRKNDPEEVYNSIKERLKNAQITDSVIELMRLPWFAVFTTNYDLAIERALVDNQGLSLRTVVTGTEFQLDGLLTELLCVKLMGSIDKPYGELGSMVLDSGDLSKAREERGRIFDTLAVHAANLSFFFIGYSFKDKLFLEILSKLEKIIGKPKNTYFALFRNEPDPKYRYRAGRIWHRNNCRRYTRIFEKNCL